jgi:hypothetical protein
MEYVGDRVTVGVGVDCCPSLRRAGLNRQQQPLVDCTVDEGDPLINTLGEGVDLIKPENALDDTGPVGPAQHYYYQSSSPLFGIKKRALDDTLFTRPLCLII